MALIACAHAHEVPGIIDVLAEAPPGSLESVWKHQLFDDPPNGGIRDADRDHVRATRNGIRVSLFA